MVTKQQLFDAIWQAKRADGFRKTTAWDGDGHPFTGNGCNCVLQEGTEAAARMGGKCSETFTFAERCQLTACHGRASSPADMERRLREFAVVRGLTIPGESKPAMTFQDFMANVLKPQPLGEDFQRVLDENRWQLYDR